AHRVTVHAEAEQAIALDEEGAPLLEESLERRQVQHGRIGLDLPEIGIDGAVEGQIRGDAILEVESAVELLRMGIRVWRRLGNRDVLGHRVGPELEPAGRGESRDTGDLSELRDEAVLAVPIERPAHPLLVTFDVAPDTEPEGVGLRIRVAELRER